MKMKPILFAVLPVILIVAGALIWFASKSRTRGHATTTAAPATITPQILDVAPGQTKTFTAGGVQYNVAVPSGEDHSIGHFAVKAAANGFDSKTLERDGSVESVLVGDINGDGCENFLIVTRSAGSGSYVELWPFLTTPQGIALNKLPDPPSAIMEGYMGQDSVSIVGNEIVRTFPIYKNGVHVDRTWKPEELKDGKLPIVTDSDPNANPRGGEAAIIYNVKTKTWRRR